MRSLALAVVMGAALILLATPPTIAYSFTQKVRTEILVSNTGSVSPYLVVAEVVTQGKMLLEGGKVVLREVRLERHGRPGLRHQDPIMPSWKLLPNYIRAFAPSSYRAWDSHGESTDSKPPGWRQLKRLLSNDSTPQFAETMVPFRPPEKERSVTLTVAGLGTLTWRILFKKESDDLWTAELDKVEFHPEKGITGHVSCNLKGILHYKKGLLVNARVAYRLCLDVSSEGLQKRLISQIGFAVERRR